MDKIEHCQSGSIAAYPFPTTRTIVFKKSFTKVPAFSFGVSRLDFHYRYNLRLHTAVKELSRKHVRVHVSTWGDTVGYGVTFSWMACPT